MRKSIVLTMAVLLALPGVALATWGGKGGYEPDTKKDRSDGWMNQNPDITLVTGTTQRDPGNVHKVYFSAFQAIGGGLSGVVGWSPNSALLQTSHAMTPNQPYALLGVWKDCNNDGYIGFQDKGLWEYRQELLLTAIPNNICKPQSVPTFTWTQAEGPSPTHAGTSQWFAVHNDGTWVHEFIPIGWDANQPQFADRNKFNINDQKARVWGDYDLPGDPGRLICWISNQPVGTFRSVGSMVEYADCFTAHRLNNAVATATGATGTGPTWNAVKATQNPWGDGGDKSYVVAFNCGDGKDEGQAHVQPSNTLGFGVHNATVPTVHNDGSPGGTANETATALDDCDRSDNQQGTETSEWEASVARGPYQTESDTVKAQYGDKHETDWVFTYAEGARGTASPLGVTSAHDAGTGLQNDVWSPGSRSLTYNGFYTPGRDSVDKVKHMTFYAYVDPSLMSGMGITMPKLAALGIYGSEACGTDIGDKLPAKNGWKCDPAKWTATARAVPGLCYGSNMGPTCDKTWVTVGQEYNLRDIDCYDESANGVRPITWGTVTNSVCA